VSSGIGASIIVWNGLVSDRVSARRFLEHPRNGRMIRPPAANGVEEQLSRRNRDTSEIDSARHPDN
jgi:hypothetical protein